jgi:lactoylglutathione lyase
MAEPPKGTETDSDDGIPLLRLELFVHDPTRSRRFYEGVLGFVLDTAAAPPTENYIPLVSGGVRLALCATEQLSDSHYFRPTSGVRLGVGVEIVFEVEHLDQYETRAHEADVVIEPTQLRSWDMWDFRIVDPDGYYIRVTRRRSDAG